MNTVTMTRAELYDFLKANSPALANGQTRAPRHELLTRINYMTAAVPSVEEMTAVPQKPLVPQRPKRKKRRLQVVRVDKIVDFVPKISIEDGRRLRTGVDMLELAAQCISRSGMTASQIAHLLYITAGVDPLEATKTLEGLLTLREALESAA